MAKASDGWKLDQIDGQPSLADLTPFESLIDALFIYDSDSVSAFSAIIRTALAVDSNAKTEVW